MTYNTSEISQASGQPVELYRFKYAIPNLVGVGVPTPPGELIVFDPLGQVVPEPACQPTPGWAGHGNFDGQSAVCRAGLCSDETDRCNSGCSFQGDSCGPFTLYPTHDAGSGLMYLRSAHKAGVADAGGYHYWEKTYGASDGLAPNTTYEVRVFAKGSPVWWNPGNRQVGLDINSTGEASQTYGIRDTAWHLLRRQGVTDGSGDLNVKLGEFDLNFGYGLIEMWFTELRIYALTGDVPEETGFGTEVTRYYTSADTTITYDGNDYLPAIITRGPYDVGGQETGDSDLELRLPSTHEVAQWFAPGGIELPVEVTMYRLHRSDLTDARTPEVAQIVGARFEGTSCVLSCAPSGIRRLARETPRQRFSIGCNHVLYGAQCGLLKQLRTLQSAAVLALSADGLEVTVEGVDAYATTRDVEGCFIGGTLASETGIVRTITDQSGDVLTLLTAAPGLTAGTLVNVSEGCAHTTDACFTQHDNIEHYGGFPGVPIRNPFDPAGRGLA